MRYGKLPKQEQGYQVVERETGETISGTGYPYGTALIARDTQENADIKAGTYRRDRYAIQDAQGYEIIEFDGKPTRAIDAMLKTWQKTSEAGVLQEVYPYPVKTEHGTRLDPNRAIVALHETDGFMFWIFERYQDSYGWRLCANQELKNHYDNHKGYALCREFVRRIMPTSDYVNVSVAAEHYLFRHDYQQPEPQTYIPIEREQPEIKQPKKQRFSTLGISYEL